MGIFDFLTEVVQNDKIYRDGMKNKKLVRESCTAFEKTFSIRLDWGYLRIEDRFCPEYVKDSDHFSIWFDTDTNIAVAIFNQYVKNQGNKYNGAILYDSKGNYLGNKISGKMVYRYENGVWKHIANLSRVQVVLYMMKLGYEFEDTEETYSLEGRGDWAVENMIATFDHIDFLEEFGMSPGYRHLGA